MTLQHKIQRARERPLEAIARAEDTCHWTNCTPQHSAFNQNKQLWQGLERHVLETGLTFPCAEPQGAAWLRDIDPLKSGAGRRRAARRAAAMEALGIGGETPSGYVLLEDGASIVRPG